MEHRRKSTSLIPNEEFSIEFGDVNGIKLYDLPLTSQGKKKIDKSKKESRRL
ncbi:MAG: hypothetical protein ACXVNF_00855 [Neobacillus sp.]